MAAYSVHDQQWLHQRHRINNNRNACAHARTYYEYSGSVAMDGWRSLLQQSPDLFKETQVSKGEVLRLYEDRQQWQMAQACYQHMRVPHQVMSLNQVVARYPATAAAIECGRIAGALAVEGWTLDIQAFTRNVLNGFVARGGHCQWQTEIYAIKRNDHGEVIHLRSSRGSQHADAYVLHLGAYADPCILKETPVAHKMGGVAGRWYLCDTTEGWYGPLKLHGPHYEAEREVIPAYDLSLIPLRDPLTGRPRIAIGGGYVYVGSPPFNHTWQPAFARIDQQIGDVLCRYFGESLRHQLVSANIRTCVRSFSVDDHPVHETMPCAGGGVLIVTGGSNTGTTALAPVFVSEVVNTLAACDCIQPDL